MILQRQLLLLFSQQLNCQDDQAKNKNKQADAVDTVHITDPCTFGTIRILFFQVQVFSYLIPDSHTLRLMFCKIKTDNNATRFNFY